jgi:hypothetical protein
LEILEQECEIEDLLIEGPRRRRRGRAGPPPQHRAAGCQRAAGEHPTTNERATGGAPADRSRSDAGREELAFPAWIFRHGATVPQVLDGNRGTFVRQDISAWTETSFSSDLTTRPDRVTSRCRTLFARGDSEEEGNPAGPGDRLRASSPMTRQRPVPWHERHCQSGIVRGPAALVLVAFALLAGPTPGAVAQTPPRPEPRELWRQFPLDTQRSTRQAPAERESTPPAAASTTGGTAEEGRDGSIVTVQIAAIVLAMALVLMLTTGTLAYALRGSFELGAYRRWRRLTPSLPEFVEAPSNAETERPERREPGAKRMDRVPSRARRRVKPAAARSLASIVAEVDALKVKLDVDAAPKKPESPVHVRIERLRERLDMYFASARNESTANDEVESLKAKLDMHPAPAKSESIARDELETLKGKLNVQPAHSESAPPNELQTLKEKLKMQPAPAKSGSTPHEELETLKAKLAKEAAFVNAEHGTADKIALKEKLGGDAAAAAKPETTVRAPLETLPVDHGPRPTSEREVDLHTNMPSPKLDVSNRPAKNRARASVARDALYTTLREPRGERLAAATPVAPRPVSAAPRRSTIAELVREYGSGLAIIGLVLIMLALLLLNIAVLFDLGVVS